MKTDEKFKKLAEQRMNRCIKLLRLIGNLSNRSHYQYSSKDAQSITNALTQEVQTIKAKFANPKGGRMQKEFSLD